MDFNEIRKDYFAEKFVVISKARKHRPHEFKQENVESKGICPFCPGNESMTEEVLSYPSFENWKIRVIENKYPILQDSKEKIDYVSDYFYPGIGKHYVIIETRDHNKRLHELSLEDIEDYLKVVGIVSDEMESDDEIEYVHFFKNEGRQSGASLRHSHSQIIAFPFVPPRIREIIDSSLNHPGCYLEHIMKLERDTDRFVMETEYFFVFTPYASIFPYELWIVPKKHIPKLSHLVIDERRNLAYLLKRFLAKAYALNGSYNMILYQAPKGHDFHMFLQILPRLSIWGGVELGTNIIVNVVSPEDAAAYYRDENQE